MATSDVPAAPAETLLPRTTMTLSTARAKLSGLHFAKECLSDTEREVLLIAEGLLRLIDDADPRGFAR